MSASQEELKQAVIDAFKSGAVVVNIPMAKIQEVVDTIVAKEISKFDAAGAKIIEEASKLIEKAKELVTVTQKIEIKSPSGLTEKEGLFHRDFKQVFSLSTARNPVSQYPVGLWLWGGAGAGKTHMAEQIAEALEVPFYPIYGGPTMTETKLLGYRNAGSGVYVKGLTYDWFKSGGLLAIDEADLGESLSCMNSLFANRVYRFPDGELIERHPNTYFIALANTNGMGARSGFRRNVQDVAALDRFNFWQFLYDEKLEKALAGDFAEFAEYVVKVRKWIQGNSKETNLHVTPRATMRGVALLASTEMDGPSVAESSIFGLFPLDTKAAVLKSCGSFNRISKEAKVAKAKQELGEARTKAVQTIQTAVDEKSKEAATTDFQKQVEAYAKKNKVKLAATEAKADAILSKYY